jgi:TrmH family RNA methyltransferase
MGSAFRLPIWSNADYLEVIEWCRKAKVATVGTTLSAELSHTELDWTKATALILGPESTGLTAEETAATSQRVKIPMRGEVESLNVSVAAGILLFEAARQRAFQS